MIRHYSEVYDLNTTVGSMTMLAIHTPQANALKKMFKGHFINYKKYKVLGCDIKIACASQLPLSPDQVGLEAGEVDPRDVMNPMLFKACTGENLNALLNQIYNKNAERQDMFGEGQGSIGEHKITNTAERRTYYQLLSDPTWRKAHPQAGLVIRNLKPYVHKVATTQPFKWTGLARPSPSGNDGWLKEAGSPVMGGANAPNGSSAGYGFGAPSGKEIDANGEWDANNPNVFVSNGVTPMPWLDTAVPQIQKEVYEGAEEANDTRVNWLINNVPRVYMGLLCMPPAVSTKFYMRAIFDWKIAFKDWRPAYEIGSINAMEIGDSENGFVSPGSSTGWTTYFNYYHDAETKQHMEENDETCKDESSFTTNGVEDSEMVYAS